jgi:hypothetical protein
LEDSWANPAIVFTDHYDFSQLVSCEIRDAKLHKFASEFKVSNTHLKTVFIWVRTVCEAYQQPPMFLEMARNDPMFISQAA